MLPSKQAVRSAIEDDKPLKRGEPCSHNGCLNHKTHPCEGCGRIAGSYESGRLIKRGEI